jgi:branched-chain amino acid transport system ATP-binding protein
VAPREEPVSAPILEAEGLTRRFGDFAAVDGVDLRVAEGTIHSVIGPNGAGKTTLFRLLTGILRPTSGALRFAGERIEGRRPHVIARKGLVQSFQMTSIFPRLTVLESVQAAIVARERRALDMLTRFQRSTVPEALELLDAVGLADFAGVRATTLSHGDQRALDIALALATGPRLLLLDEPTAGMSPRETQRITGLVADLARERRLTVLFSEHDMDVVFGISQRVTVLHQGAVIAEGSVAEVQVDPQVMAVYLGEDSLVHEEAPA